MTNLGRFGGFCVDCYYTLYSVVTWILLDFGTGQKTISFFVPRLANKLQPGAVKVNDLSKVSNPAMRTNKEVRIQRVVAKELSFPDPLATRQKVGVACVVGLGTGLYSCSLPD